MIERLLRSPEQEPVPEKKEPKKPPGKKPVKPAKDSGEVFLAYLAKYGPSTVAQVFPNGAPKGFENERLKLLKEGRIVRTGGKGRGMRYKLGYES